MDILRFFPDAQIEGPTPLDGSMAMVGYSVRSRAFTKSFFSSFNEFCYNNSLSKRIIIFDVPYAYNDAADEGVSSPSKEMFNKASTIGDERVRMINNALGNELNNSFITRWHEFDNSPLVGDLRKELKSACAADYNLKYSLLTETANRIHRNGFVTPEFFLNFLLQEIPILCFLYYSLNYLIDVYPGTNFPIFKQIESGQWKGVLPLASSLANGKRLTFINTSGMNTCD